MRHRDSHKIERTMDRNVQERLYEALTRAGARELGAGRRVGQPRPACRLSAELAGRGWRWGHAWDRLISRHRKAIDRDAPACRLPAPLPQQP